LGMAALYLALGCYETIDWVAPPMYYPRGCKVAPAQPIKEAVSIPVIIDGRIDDAEFAEKLLVEQKADFIAIGRPLLADPEWPKKVMERRSEDIRSCIYCNECIDRSFRGQYSWCTVNPALGREREKEYRIIWPAPKRKKVLVVGGGPAGMRSATIASLKGHEVTLYEKADRLGGNLWAASAPPFKASIRPLINWLIRETTKAGVRIETGKEATLELIQRNNPDLVVVATGSTPVIPTIQRANAKNVFTAIDVETSKASVGNSVVIVGGGSSGLDTALHLTQMGKKVTILEMLPDIAMDARRITRMALLRLLRENEVNWFTQMKLDEIRTTGVVAVDRGGRRQVFSADSVVLATGMKANDELFKALEGKIAEVYKIGDAREPRRIIDAIHEGEIIARGF
ncbi:FAD-dependent oxidoreductase, partial [Chloroflexota bacterium]